MCEMYFSFEICGSIIEPSTEAFLVNGVKKTPNKLCLFDFITYSGK